MAERKDWKAGLVWQLLAIAVWKVLAATFQLGVACVLAFPGLLDRWVIAAQEFIVQSPLLSRYDWLNRFLTHLVDLSPGKRHWILAFVIIHALLDLIEAAGLCLKLRWAEWLIVIRTSMFIPLEIYEIWRHATIVRVNILLINILIVLVVAMHLHHKEKRAS